MIFVQKIKPYEKVIVFVMRKVQTSLLTVELTFEGTDLQYSPFTVTGPRRIENRHSRM
jgi:hypothetical protein